MTVSKPALPCAILAAGAAILGAFPAPAYAGQVACRYENGAVVVAAGVAGLTGDYILDPSTPQTELHETRAQGAGIADTALAADIALAGLTLPARPIVVVNLDARSAGFSTPISGVIGADALSGHILDLQFAPCRLGFFDADNAPPFPRGQVMAVLMVGGAPSVAASVTDNRMGGVGLFAIDMGSVAMVRLSDRLAVAVPPLEGDAAADRAHAPAYIAALSFNGEVLPRASSGLVTGLDPALSGAIGNGVWSRWRMRLDLKVGTLTLAPP
jgi:hypothetical protein